MRTDSILERVCVASTGLVMPNDDFAMIDACKRTFFDRLQAFRGSYFGRMGNGTLREWRARNLGFSSFSDRFQRSKAYPFLLAYLNWEEMNGNIRATNDPEYRQLKMLLAGGPTKAVALGVTKAGQENQRPIQAFLPVSDAQLAVLEAQSAVIRDFINAAGVVAGVIDARLYDILLKGLQNPEQRQQLLLHFGPQPAK